MKTTIIIPAHNEEKRIGKMLKEYSLYFESVRKKSKEDYELLIVINNTKDNTESIVKKEEKSNSRIKHVTLTSGGKGYAVKEGFKKAVKSKVDYIGFVDADLATGPKDFHDLILNIKNNDGVLASRYLKESKLYPGLSFRRTIVSRIFNFVVRVLFGLKYKDTQCGAKLFRKDIIKKINPKLTITQWAFDIDLLYQIEKQSGKIIEIPTVWYEKDGSKLNIIKTSLQMFFAVIQLRLLNSPLKRVFMLLKPFAGAIWRRIK